MEVYGQLFPWYKLISLCLALGIKYKKILYNVLDCSKIDYSRLLDYVHRLARCVIRIM